MVLQRLEVTHKLDYNENELINNYELLFRLYEVTNQHMDMTNFVATCARRFKDCSDLMNVSRALKLTIYAPIKSLKSYSKKQLIYLIQVLKLKRRPILEEWKQNAFQTYFIKSESGDFALRSVQNPQCRQISQLNSREKLVSGYTGLLPRSNSEAEELMQRYDIACCLAGDSFMLELLREY